jgi:DNA mismatch repair ATPase MutS
MQLDKITLSDISVFSTEEEFSIFHKLNFTRTSIGKDWLRHFFSQPFSDKNKILGTQRIITAFHKHHDTFPGDITNGTILVINKFLDYDLDSPQPSSNTVNAYFYKWFHQGDFSIIKFSLKHFSDFLRTIRGIAQLLAEETLPAVAGMYVERVLQLLRKDELNRLASLKRNQPLPITDTLNYANYLYNHGRGDMLELIEILGRFDAWHSMSLAVKKFDLHFPVFVEREQPLIRAKGLYHVLIPHPVPYDLEMNPENNFLFLTGANMAGKSTLIKSVGSAVYLAHLGMGVPAKEMNLTIFDGMLTNINVMDNIAKGESYFFNEVQRIKTTIEQINDGRKWLVLIDELFKGTNVQDAMKCSSTVIKGLIKIKNSLFILSTHLYEIGDELRAYPNISFRYFETQVIGDQLVFSYQLKEGISNDRFGYLILKKEKVVELLEKL